MTASTSGRAAVFLDRDGVLNEALVVDGRPYPPDGVDDLRLLPGVVEACRALADAGLSLVVVTNQPDIARGTRSAAEVARINDALAAQLPLTQIRVCPHDDADGCGCRKPAPGLILDAAAELGLDPARSVMVGDRWRDIDAGRAAGCRTVLVDRAYDEAIHDIPDLVVDDLGAAVGWILEATRSAPADATTEDTAT